MTLCRRLQGHRVAGRCCLNLERHSERDRVCKNRCEHKLSGEYDLRIQCFKTGKLYKCKNGKNIFGKINSWNWPQMIHVSGCKNRAVINKAEICFLTLRFVCWGTHNERNIYIFFPYRDPYTETELLQIFSRTLQQNWFLCALGPPLLCPQLLSWSDAGKKSIKQTGLSKQSKSTKAMEQKHEWLFLIL